MKNKLPKWLEKLESRMEKDWGIACTTYEPFCHVCRVWEAMAILEDLYGKVVEDTREQLKEKK
jgi:hypothetical protein